MAGRRCFIEDKFISVASCEEHQALEGEMGCKGCDYVGVTPGDSAPLKNSKEAPCGECGRTGLSKPARGLCFKCYNEQREKEKGAIPDNPNPPLPPPAPPAKEVAAAESPTPAREAPLKKFKKNKELKQASPRDYTLLLDILIAAFGFGWVVALYWLGGYDFTRGNELAAAFFGASCVGAVAVFMRPRG